MKKNCLGIGVSVMVHACIIMLLMAASFTGQERPIKVVEIDFSLTKYPSSSGGYVPKIEKSTTGNKPRILKTEKALGKSVERGQSVKQNPANIPAKEQAELPPVAAVVTVSDNHGETVIHGTPATYTNYSGSGTSLHSRGGYAGGTEGVGAGGGGRGTGKSNGNGEFILEEGNDYNHIRDAIMKNIEYPEWARRMGFEGKTLLSFIVLENGTISRIKVVKSSGYMLLDDSAKEGVARTVISKKVPYRVIVHLPVIYKLRVS